MIKASCNTTVACLFKVHGILTEIDVRDKESKQLGQNAQGKCYK